MSQPAPRPTPDEGEIVVAGLGPGAPEYLTVETARWLGGDFPVYLRTRVHPTVAGLAGAEGWPSFDRLYDEAADFPTLYDAIVDQLLAEARRAQTPIVYAVPGHPLVGESTVTRLLAAAPGAGIAVRVLPAVSFLDVAIVALGLDPLAANVQLVDALDLAAAIDDEPFSGGRLPLVPTRPALVAQVYGARVASATKLALMRLYPDEHPITLLQGCGSAGATARQLPLHELDQLPVDHLTSVYLPALAPERSARAPQALQAIVARLRAPGGCPWDREQTHQSIRKHLLEEAYEVLDAIDAGEPDAFREELGDLLLQVYLHAQIAEEAGSFLLEDVYEVAGEKLVRRHPHVFGAVVANDSGAVLRNWEQIKVAERAARGARNGDPPPSALDGVPRSLPALARAQLVQERVNRLVPSPDDATTYSARAIAALDGMAAAGPARRRELLGDALFALTGLARAQNLDPDEALEAVVARFTARFRTLEAELRAGGGDWHTAPAGAGAELWPAGADRQAP